MTFDNSDHLISNVQCNTFFKYISAFVQMYSDCLKSFRESISDILEAGTNVDIEVGPCSEGEFRYPSYSEPQGCFPRHWRILGEIKNSLFDYGYLSYHTKLLFCGLHMDQLFFEVKLRPLV